MGTRTLVLLVLLVGGELRNKSILQQKMEADEESWTEEAQEMLEEALRTFSIGCVDKNGEIMDTNRRWDSIAAMVDSKSKKEAIFLHSTCNVLQRAGTVCTAIQADSSRGEVEEGHSGAGNGGKRET